MLPISISEWRKPSSTEKERAELRPLACGQAKVRSINLLRPPGDFAGSPYRAAIPMFSSAICGTKFGTLEGNR